MAICHHCHQGGPDVNLRFCKGCLSVQYCSKACQKDDWPSHREPCRRVNPIPPDPNDPYGSAASWIHEMLTRATRATGSGETGSEETGGEEMGGAYGPSPPRGLDSGIAEPFTRLQNGTYLHDRSETDVYRILIESFRFRMEEQCHHTGTAVEGTVYAQRDDSLPAFRLYLDAAESRPNLLPPWWTPGKRRECEAFGMAGHPQDLRAALEHMAATFNYGDSRFPSQLRMLAEAVYGNGVGGMSSFTRRAALAQLEVERR